MGKILNIETSTTNCSVALGRDGELVAVKEDYSNNYSHAERLHIYIEAILKENGWSMRDLDAVAISKGPGSYTGLRIGVSAAKGLSYSLGIPLLSVGTLESLSYQVEDAELDFIVPMLDARRMEVYTAVFSAEKCEITPTHARILDETSFGSLLEQGRSAFIGNGVKKFREVCNHPNAVFVEDKLPSAGEMVKLAENKFQSGDLEDVAYFEPFYLKDFIAGRKK